MSIFLILVTVIMMLIKPQMRTMPRACCQGIPMASTTVNVKKALSPIPGACAKGTLAYSPIISVPIMAETMVATKTAPLSMPATERIDGLTIVI